MTHGRFDLHMILAQAKAPLSNARFSTWSTYMTRNMTRIDFDEIDGLSSEFADGLAGAFAKIICDCGPYLEKHPGRRGSVAREGQKDAAARLRDRSEPTAKFRKPGND